MPLLSADSAAFPVDPPADLYESAAIAAHDWAAFSALEEMTDHWARPGWSDGTRAYYWMLTFPDSPTLTALAMHCQEALAPLTLNPVPTDGLHITLARVGTPDTISPGKLRELAQSAQRVLPAAFSLLALPLAGSKGAVRLSVAPRAPVIRLHAALLQAGAAVTIAPKKPTAAFRPHLSLAYNNRRRPAAPLIEAVTQLRSQSAVELHVGDVQLVELRRTGTQYQWDALKSLPLTAQGADRHRQPAG